MKRNNYKIEILRKELNCKINTLQIEVNNKKLVVEQHEKVYKYAKGVLITGNYKVKEKEKPPYEHYSNNSNSDNCKNTLETIRLCSALFPVISKKVCVIQQYVLTRKDYRKQCKQRLRRRYE